MFAIKIQQRVATYAVLTVITVSCALIPAAHAQPVPPPPPPGIPTYPAQSPYQIPSQPVPQDLPVGIPPGSDGTEDPPPGFLEDEAYVSPNQALPDGTIVGPAAGAPEGAVIGGGGRDPGQAFGETCGLGHELFKKQINGPFFVRVRSTCTANMRIIWVRFQTVGDGALYPEMKGLKCKRTNICVFEHAIGYDQPGRFICAVSFVDAKPKWWHPWMWITKANGKVCQVAS
jgi:hypothetical protein